MVIEITHENGKFRFSYKRHVIIAIGMTFLVAGLAGLLVPWWQPFLFVLLNKADLSVDDETNYFVNGVLITIGLGFLLYKYLVIDTRDSQIARDKAMLAAHLPQPAAPKTYLDNLVDDHSYLSSQDSVFQHSYTIFKNTETAFQHKKTIKLYDEYSKIAQEMHGFVKSNFNTYPNTQKNCSDYRYAMAPHLNFDRDMVVYDANKVQQYAALKTTLHQQVREVKKSYHAFLKHLRKIGCL